MNARERARLQSLFQPALCDVARATKKGAIDAGLAFQVRDARDPRARVASPADRRDLLAGRPPDVRGARRVSFRRGQQRIIVVAQHDDFLRNREYPAFSWQQAIRIPRHHSRILRRHRIPADINSRAIRTVVAGTDHHGWRESRRRIAEARRQVRRRRVLCSRRVRGQNHFPGNKVDDLIAVGVAEHPAR